MRKLLPILALIIFIAFALYQSKSQNSKNTVLSKETSPQTLDDIRQITIKIDQRCKTEPAICYEDGVRNDLLEKYPTTQILEAIYDFDKYYSCHAFTHFIGRALYKKTASIPDAYSQVNFTCHGGTYHGVLEAFLDERKTTVEELSGQKLEQVCKDSRMKLEKSQDQVFTECLHGFGHAFMFITNSDLPKSLIFCDKLDPIYQERCWGGAFMENSTSSTNVDHPTQWLSKDDKFYPCTILDQRYLSQCYFYQANYLLKETHRNWDQVFADCAQLDKKISHDYCVLGIGGQLASVTNEQGVMTAASVCQKAPDNDDSLICTEGAIPSLFARYGGDAPQIFEFCQNTANFLREFCFAKLGMVARTYWQYDDNRLESTCQKAGLFKNACLDSSGQKFQY